MSSGGIESPDTVGADLSRRLTLRRLWTLFTGLTTIGGTSVLLDGCGSGGGEDDGGAAADTTPPTVTATSPANGAIGLALNSSISATFSEPMNNATLNATSFTLVPTAGGPAIAGTVSVSGSTATFTPSASLAGSTQYTATITTAAQDIAGNSLATGFTWNFTTGVAPDTTPPSVSSTLPADGAVGVAISSSVSATFSEPMNNGTLNTTSFTLVPTAGGSAIAGTVNVGGNTATFTPSASLAGSTQYTATITTAAQDAAGNAMAATFSWNFTTATPTLGAHGLVFTRLDDNVASVSVGPLATQASGSTILACVGRGDISQHTLPTDNAGNAPYVQLGTSHPYNLWQSSGTALYAFPSAAGSGGHIVSATNTPIADDEITLAVVEIKNGGVVADFQWNEVTLASGNPVTSLSVTTTGPATLVAFWWGDADQSLDKTAVPGDGFAVCDSILIAGALVQCAVATKDVATAGTYNVTWAATPPQGAQLWLVAVQSAP